MVAYTISSARQEDSSVRTSLHIEGNVTSEDWDRLRELCIDVLKNSEQMVLNVEKVSNFDYSFSVLICLLRRTVQLLKKRLTIVGESKHLFLCVYEIAMKSNSVGCSFADQTPCCVWENLFANSSFRA